MGRGFWRINQQPGGHDMSTIKPGHGFHVGVNFARAKGHVPIKITGQEGRTIYGIIPADPKSPLGFLRDGVIQVRVSAEGVSR
jgi:hypothetical protein